MSTQESGPVAGRDGIVFDMPSDEYHGSELEISCTGMKDLAQSPFHFYSRHRDPRRPPSGEKSGQLEGTLAHCAALEPDAFLQRYVVISPDAPRKPTTAQWNAKNPSPDSVAAMRWWSDFSQQNQGKTIIEAAQYETAMRQAENVRRLPEFRELAINARTEVSAFWTDPETGVRCRCRPDLAHPAGSGGVILADLKTFADASPDAFRFQVERKLYDLQDAFYSKVYAGASGCEVLAFVFFAVEDSWPFAASCHMLDDQSRERGAQAVRVHLARYAECMRTGEWPSYPAGVNLLSVRTRALKNQPR